MPRPRSEASRQAILDATVELLEDGGWGALTVEAIAARAGVGKQTIYRWYGGDLGRIVVDAFIGASDQRLDPPNTGSVRGDLLGIVVPVARLNHDRDTGTALANRTLMAHAQTHPAFAETYRALHEHWREPISQPCGEASEGASCAAAPMPTSSSTCFSASSGTASSSATHKPLRNTRAQASTPHWRHTSTEPAADQPPPATRSDRPRREWSRTPSISRSRTSRTPGSLGRHRAAHDGALTHLAGSRRAHRLAVHARSAIPTNPARARLSYAAADDEWSTSIETYAWVEVPKKYLSGSRDAVSVTSVRTRLNR